MDNHMLTVGGKSFRCECGCNVFHKGKYKGLWICNGCGTEYGDETYIDPKLKNCKTCLYKDYSYTADPCCRCTRNPDLEDCYEDED